MRDVYDRDALWIWVWPAGCKYVGSTTVFIILLHSRNYADLWTVVGMGMVAKEQKEDLCGYVEYSSERIQHLNPSFFVSQSSWEQKSQRRQKYSRYRRQSISCKYVSNLFSRCDENYRPCFVNFKELQLQPLITKFWKYNFRHVFWNSIVTTRTSFSFDRDMYHCLAKLFGLFT